VLLNGRDDWSPSPVRPDLRPLMGVLLAAHAFVPVAALHAALQAQGHPLGQGDAFEARRREVLNANASALATVAERGEPTALGKRLLDDLWRLQRHCEAAAG
jgi:HEXXH motif-containing protein